MENCRIALLTAFTAVAVLFDLRTDKIPNRLLLAGTAAGFLAGALQATAGPNAGISDGMAWKAWMLMVSGALLPLLFPGILYVFGLLGAGDVKLFCMMGVYLGAKEGWQLIKGAFLLGGIYAAVLLLIRKNARARFTYLVHYFRQPPAQRDPGGYLRGTPASGRMHFSVPVFLSLLLWAAGKL